MEKFWSPSTHIHRIYDCNRPNTFERAELSSDGDGAPFPGLQQRNGCGSERIRILSGADHLIVPNIIHFVCFNLTEYSFVDYICLKAAFRNHRPDNIYIHTDVGKQYHGKYWEWIQNDPELKARVVLIHLDAPSEVFGQKLSAGWRFYHGSDVARIQILMKYGGIYLDNDVYVIKNLDKYYMTECILKI